MRIVALERGKETELSLADGATVADLARALRVPLESAVFLLGDVPVPTDEPLADGARVRVVSAISGG